MLIQMLGSFHQSQQELLREELARVHEISREMRQIQSQLALPQAPGVVESPESRAIAYETGDSGGLESEEDPLPAPSLFPLELEAPVEPTPAERKIPPKKKLPAREENGDAPEARAKSNEVHEHALLFQRMQTLDRERNSRFQKILRAIKGSG
jgi:hypothetical protein